MENNEIYYVSENTYKKIFDYCATKLLAAEMKNIDGEFTSAHYFRKASDDIIGAGCYIELESLLKAENIPTDPLEIIDNCPPELLRNVIGETLKKFVVGVGETVKPGTQFVSKETYFYILADIAETLFYDFTTKHNLPKQNFDAEYEFYDWFNERINTNSSNISEMIVRDGASPKLIVDLCNRAEGFEEVIVEIFDKFRVKPF